MARKASSVDVARRAGVSQATVSYVLNRRSDQVIREETRQRVLEAARELNYQPSLAARSMVTGKTNMVALWVPNTYHSTFNHVVENVMRLARQSQFHVIIVQIKTETRESLLQSGFLSSGNLDGILALDARDLINDILETQREAPPIVSMGPAFSRSTDHVGVDLYGGSMLAVRHLHESGCRRIAYAGLKEKLIAGDPRYDAYLKVMEEIGKPSELLPLESGDYEGSYAGFQSYFSTENHPDGLLCWNDEVAIGGNRALANLGLRVPQDVALIGSDGIRETLYAVPTISSVAQPFDEMCHLAWQFLQNRLAQPDMAVQGTVLPMSLQARCSTQRAESTF